MNINNEFTSLYSSPPVFSVIVPIYRVEDYIEQCISSILNQSFRDFEVILVDDGSPDKCSEICDSYAKNDSRVRVIHKSNSGLVAARKTGIESSKGKYIVYVDGDDYIDLDLLAKLNKTINEYNEPDIVNFSFQYISNDGTKDYVVKSKLLPGYYIDDSLRFLSNRLLYDLEQRSFNTGCLIYNVWANAFKRDLICKFQMTVDNSITNGEDVAVFIPSVLNCKSLYVMDFVGYYYRRNPESMVNSFKKSELNSFIKVLCSLENTSLNKENICAYGYRVLQVHLIKGARTINNAKDYVNYCNSVIKEPWVSIISSFKQPKLRFKNRIGVFLIKKKRWFLLWYLYSVIKKQKHKSIKSI